jgi:hypothetical protein
VIGIFVLLLLGAAYLLSLGSLFPRFLSNDCTWATEEEKALIAELPYEIAGVEVPVGSDGPFCDDSMTDVWYVEPRFDLPLSDLDLATQRATETGWVHIGDHQVPGSTRQSSCFRRDDRGWQRIELSIHWDDEAFTGVWARLLASDRPCQFYEG